MELAMDLDVYECFVNQDIDGLDLHMLVNGGVERSVSVIIRYEGEPELLNIGMLVGAPYDIYTVLDFFNNYVELLSKSEVKSAWNAFVSYGPEEFWQKYDVVG